MVCVRCVPVFLCRSRSLSPPFSSVTYHCSGSDSVHTPSPWLYLQDVCQASSHPGHQSLSALPPLPCLCAFSVSAPSPCHCPFCHQLLCLSSFICHRVTECEQRHSHSSTVGTTAVPSKLVLAAIPTESLSSVSLASLNSEPSISVPTSACLLSFCRSPLPALTLLALRHPLCGSACHFSLTLCPLCKSAHPSCYIVLASNIVTFTPASSACRCPLSLCHCCSIFVSGTFSFICITSPCVTSVFFLCFVEMLVCSWEEVGTAPTYSVLLPSAFSS